MIHVAVISYSPTFFLLVLFLEPISKSLFLCTMYLYSGGGGGGIEAIERNVA